jgi:hypothetical protein
MPQVVYGVQTFHPTHKITVPEPSLTAAKGVPNACNQCHVDKSVNWAIEKANLFWPSRYGNTKPSTDLRFDIAEGVRGLFAGDALTRAMMADAVARHSDSRWAEPYFIEAFEHDNYPVVRYFIADALSSWHPDAPKPDYFWPDDTRSRMMSLWWIKNDAGRADEARSLSANLRAGRKEVDLEVGE